ncbi:required for meiotic nuclear division protein 1 homolog [Ptychodera flava]|uniref:required for meiotic nuclear division protein 1 homolog n=1 Tax=Ptychodera flava TaxID=63121 RepID=UPI00396A595D
MKFFVIKAKTQKMSIIGQFIRNFSNISGGLVCRGVQNGRCVPQQTRQSYQTNKCHLGNLEKSHDKLKSNMASFHHGLRQNSFVFRGRMALLKQDSLALDSKSEYKSISISQYGCRQSNKHIEWPNTNERNSSLTNMCLETIRSFKYKPLSNYNKRNNISSLVDNSQLWSKKHFCQQNEVFRSDVRWNSTSGQVTAKVEESNATAVNLSQLKKTEETKQSTDKKHLKSRPRTKNPSRLAKEDQQDSYLCTAFSTAEEYNLEHLSYDLQAHKLCTVSSMPQDVQDVLHMRTSNSIDGEPDIEPGEIFFFREGSAVFWNVQDLTMKKVLRILSKHEISAYEVALVNWENEQMQYRYIDQSTRLGKEEIMLNLYSDPQTVALEKFAFSNAMALSVKLAIWEYSLDRFVGSIEWVPENLKAGKKLKMSMVEVMKRVGELFAFRHSINLSSDLLMTPDFYWDRDHLEHIYVRMCKYLNITRRTKVMNEKLNHCSEMIELMRTHLNDKHSIRLEWMIILLIMIEVVFEIVHYAERFVERKYQPATTDIN